MNNLYQTKQTMLMNKVKKAFFVRYLLILALLLGASLPAMAADYVITYTTSGTTYYLGMDNNNQLVAKTTPDATCVWQGYYNGDYSLSTTTRINIRNKNNTNYYLYYDGSSIVASTTAQRRWYGGNGSSIYYYNGGTTRYIHNSGSTITASNSATNAFIPYTVTVTSVASISTNPTISGADVLTATGNSTYTATGATYRIGYTNYQFNNNANHYVDANGNSFTGTPANANITYSWSLTDNAYATVNNSGVVTVSSLPEYDIALTLTVTATADGGTPAAPANTTFTDSKQITIQGTKPSAPIISVSGNTVTLSTTAAGSTTIRYTTDGGEPTTSTGTVYSSAIDLSSSATSPVTIKAITVRNGVASDVSTETVTLTLPEPVITVNAEAGTATVSATAGATIYYTTDGSTPTTSSSQYSGSITGLTMMQTVKAIAVKSGWNNSPVASETVTIPSGVSGGVVTLFDYEPHSWSYYSDPDCPIRSLSPADVKITYYGDGIVMSNNDDYTAGTNNYVSPGDGNYVGGAKVNVGGENENTFVYYKTLERGANTQTAYTFSSSSQSAAESRCPYTTIPNPFQVRPTYGSLGSTEPNDFTGWRGFQCWRLKSFTGGTVYSGASGNNALAVGAVVNAETPIYFAPNSEYGMEVELEAVWARAYLIRTSNSNKAPAIPSYNVGVERNFVILATGDNYRFNGGSGNRITNTGYAATISSYYPNGNVGNTGATVSGNNNNITLGANTKFENVTLSAASYTLTTSGYDVIIGRGCTSTNIGTVRGLSDNTSGAVEYTIRLESGTFGTFNMIDGSTHTHSGTVSAKTIFGSDYDRAKSDNNKLSIGANNTVYGASSYQAFSSNTNRNNLTYDWNIKSGQVQASKGVAAGSAAECIYMGNSGNGNDSDGNLYQGKRRMIMEGGEVCNIAGGLNNYGNNYANYIVNDGWALQIRIKGGTVRGSVYGAAEFAGASGDRQFIITGGTINGWVAGGANGTHNDGGELYGSTALYIGGTVVIGSESGGTHVGGYNASYGTNGADGGNVFGAGCGIYPTNGNYQTGTVGRVNSSVVAIADEATIWRDVYGGGNYGWVRDNGTSDLYILGGTVNGSVFGGSNNQQGQEVTITMKGGTIKGNTIGDASKIGGLYGGSNSWGTINDNVTMQIDGGQVGTPSKTANIHGGGYGSSTRVSQNVEITLGTTSQTTPGVTVYGDVYGGSALGYVNGTAATNTYHTYVTLNKGIINGSLYGGGLGDGSTAANVYGPVQVKVYGGSVRKTDANGANGSGGVYGANNVNGAPQRSVTVDIYGTDPAPSANEYALFAVYGGGNAADYTYGNTYPKVTVHNCDNSIEYVYGGGNAAAVASTDVKIYGGNKIGTVFGGGNGQVTAANVTGNTSVNIYGGTILHVFGGSNTNGTIGGSISVNVDKAGDNDPEGTSTACDMIVGEVYGGGNLAASNVGNITIGCTGSLVAGDNGHAAHPENIGVTLEGVGYVYGGANQANITGDITLDINDGIVGNVFGGNNTSGTISGGIAVNIEKTGSCDWYVGNVFGGGNLAQYTIPDGKALAVNILNGTVSGNVYGGGKGNLVDGGARGSAGKVTGNPAVTIGDNNGSHTAIVSGDVYGGGDAADVAGTPVIVVNDCNTEIGYLYGGGNAADVNGTSITFNAGTVHHDAFGGGHGDKDASNPSKYADVKGNVVFNVYGGTFGRVFAGSNSKGDITGSSALTINKTGTCAMKIGEVYGGGNEAAGKAGSVNIGCTGSWTSGAGNTHDNANLTDNRIGYELEGIGTVYGGANQANIGTAQNNSNITLNVNSGMVNRVFGGNNTSGTINGTIAVNINKTSDACSWYVGDVFGGGNLAAYSGSPTVTLTAGTVSGNIYGGGNEAGTGGSTVNINGGAMTAGKGIYGGCNTSGTVTGNIAVNINGGTLGTSGNALYGIFGGGYGQSTETEGNVNVTIGSLDGTKTPTIYGDIYGGSALGNVNDDNNDITTVNFYNGTLHGNIFGGGLGDKASLGGGHTDVAAKVNGQVYVNVGAESQTDANCHINLKDASVYGCNNTNGSPQDTVVVHIWKTDHMVTDTAEFVGTEPGTPTYAITNVFGGGKNADYLPENGLASSTKRATVHVHGCGNTIQNVYAGGDAAAATGVSLTIDGGRFDLVFGGGNGTVVAANINDGGTNTVINAGIINKLFGGSNTQGTISGEMRTVINKTGSCIENIKEFFAGGNLAPITADLNTIINCNTVFGDLYGGANMASITGDVTLTINGGTIENVYAGSKGVEVGNSEYPDGVAANIDGNVTLNLYGGDIGNAFGGSNINGNIKGLIRVNLDWSQSDCGQKQIDNIYGASNLAQYNPVDSCRAAGKYTPLVTLINGTVGRTEARTGHVAFIPDSLHSLGRVFGSGKGDVNTPAAGKVTANPKVWLNATNTTYVIVLSSVYGGGEVASVDGSTLVQLTNGHVGCNEMDMEHDNGFVFGGGMGDTQDPDLAYIRDSSKVVMTGGYVHNTIFGGGQIASIGTYNRANASYVAAHPNDDIVENEPYELKIANTGRSIVEISGGQVGPKNVTMAADLGYVFGSSMGFYTQPGVSYTDPKVNSIVEGRQNAKFGYVDSAEVRISGTALIVGAVWGGSENGQVLHSCGVKVSGGQIGIGNGKSEPYSKSLWTEAKNAVQSHDADAIKAVAAKMTECNHFPYADPYLPYDPYADIDAWSAGVATTSTTYGDGHTYFGNVFGGGSGYYPYRVPRVVNPAQDSNVWYAFQGRVRGNTRVEITDSAHVLTSIYGGCEYADVMGDATVVMTGGTLGIPRTVEATLNHPVTCYLFGAGKGDQRTIFNTRTHVRNTFVTIGGDAMIYGSVFGGGEDGHVDSSATVTITGNAIVGTWGTSYYDGNIFGGGRGFGGTSLTAGSMGGNATVNINGDCKILGNVYGGGRLASVGLHIVDSVDVTHYGHLQGDASGDDASLKATHGKIVINISGGTIGSGIEFAPATFATDRAYVVNDVVFYDNNIWRFKAAHPAGAWDTSHVNVIDHTTGGNVFGGSMGRLTKINGTKNHLWPGLAKVRKTNVNITDTARIYGNVYGGGELGYVMDSTNITINGNAEIGYGIGELPNERYTGSVFGGGYGSDDIKQHTNDTASLNDTYVTGAMHSGRVYGNTRVTISGAHIWGNVYGGGELASVGRRWINMTNDTAAGNYMPYVGTTGGSYTDNNSHTYNYYGLNPLVGVTNVTISDSAEIGDVTDHIHISTERSPGWVAGKTGGVFGGGKGHPGESDNHFNDFHYTRMAYVDSANVNIKGGHMAVVFGGAENGHVRYDTRVTMTDGIVGVPLAFDEVLTDEYGYSPTPVYQGNVYGGGRGIDSTSEHHLGAASGQVFRNTYVTISGGQVMHNVYGGGSLASVGTHDGSGNYIDGTGDAHVTIKGNAIIGSTLSRDAAMALLNITGTPSSAQEADITALQNEFYGVNNGRVFGSGRGVSGAAFADRAFTHNTYVTIGSDDPAGKTCHVYGAVFGSGENGHVNNNTYVYIKKGCKIGEYWGSLLRESDKNYIGSVYGGGRGVDLDGGHVSTTAGLVKGNTNVIVTGGEVFHSVFGGGSMASVGTMDDATNPPTYSGGLCTVTINGGIIGTDGQNNGDVFGAGRGNAGTSNYTPVETPHPDSLTWTRDWVNIDGKNYRTYKKQIDGKWIQYRQGTLAEEGYIRLIGNDPIWVRGKDRSSYEDSVVTRDYTHLTYVNNTNVTINYPAASASTWSTTTVFPAKLDSMYHDKYFLPALEATVTATAGEEYIHGNVYGGGDNGHVRGNTNVVINQGRIGTLTSNTNGNVFGGGNGSATSYDGTFSYTAGRVEGNTTVTVNDGWILHNVYGGGDMACVGNFEVDLAVHGDDPANIASHDKNDWLNGGYDVVGYTTSGGLCTVNILGGHIGEQRDKIMSGGNVIAGMDSRDANLGGNVFGSSRGQSLSEASVRRMAWTNMTVVNIDPVVADPNNPPHVVYGSVFGGGENGHVFYTATVNIQGDTIGVPNLAATGDIYRGNVYGGGRGIDPVDGGTTFSRSSGLILGNTYVNMTGGVVCRNVFGGGSMATVGTYSYRNGSGADKDSIISLDRPETGKTEVNISAGQVGFNGVNNGNVFGAGRGVAGLQGESMLDAHTYVSRTYVTISGTANITGNVFGSGDNGHVFDSTQVVILGGIIGSGAAGGGTTIGNVFGSGRGADTYTTTAKAEVKHLSPNAGRVGRQTKVYVVGGIIRNNVYGGGFLASVGGSTTVTVADSAQIYKEAWKYTGAIPEDTGTYQTFKGAAAPAVWGDVFGGSALGEIGNPDGTTTVNILGGTIGSTSNYYYNASTGAHKGNIFGGGNGDAENHDMDSYANGTTDGKRPANVHNTVRVNIGEAAQYNHNDWGATITGDVFGGNNVDGSPTNNIFVDIYSTKHTAGTNDFNCVKGFDTPADVLDTNDLKAVVAMDSATRAGKFALLAVYGGGNKATVIPAESGKTTTVTIHECQENTVRYVYGGGNAADLGNSSLEVNTSVVIEGGHIYQAYAGGNGAGTGNPGANIYGDATVTVKGGAVNQVFGGSNTLGMVYGVSKVDFATNAAECELITREVYGGGNVAPAGNVIVNVPCGTTGLVDVYGGAFSADIGTPSLQKDVTLNIFGGDMHRVFGGNKSGGTIYGNVTVNVYGSNPSHTIGEVFGGCNLGGNILGKIEVNIDSDYVQCPTCPLQVDSVYGGSNLAPYTPDADYFTGDVISPVVHVIRGTVNEAVYGGGYGAPAIVTANPNVIIGSEAVDKIDYPVKVGSASGVGDIFGGGNAAQVIGNTKVEITGNNTIVKRFVFGGGNAAEVDGDTMVWLRKRARVFSNIYGGGNQGPVTGNTKVIINGD